ncbi:MAG TPA: hypothetical protein VEI55_03370 [Candidatus Acidoferrum sp.]|nr:hypothetical protein [Candidatus Acidoferrum sp.]
MERPTGVTVIAVLAFIGAFCLFFAAFGMFLGGAILSSLANRPGLGMIAGMGGAIVGVVFLGVAAVYLVLGIGLWKLQNWARIVTVILVGLGLLFNAFSLLHSVLHLHVILFFMQAVVTAIDVWVVVYLLTPNVRQAFKGTGL